MEAIFIRLRLSSLALIIALTNISPYIPFFTCERLASLYANSAASSGFPGWLLKALNEGVV